MAKAPLHSTDAESARSALFIGYMLPVFSLFSPCSAGSAPRSVQRGVLATGCKPRPPAHPGSRRASATLLREGVSTIPILVAGDRRLKGFYLTKNRIRRFLDSLTPTV